ncbi:MAG: type II toxin-antitoxin system RelE/ParE family toxin [Pseudomonadota bacterium]
MNEYRVRIARDAEDDLREIVQFIASVDTVQKAEVVLDTILDVCDSLKAYPGRGRYVPELKAVGVTAFRELIRTPHRIIYEISGRTVQVLVIADGRRSLGALLHSRLVR